MTIDKVEFDVDLYSILQELVSELRANGIPYLQKMTPTSTHIQVCCPYHSDGMERRPSMGIRKSDGLCHCFTCNEVHSFPEFISQCFGKDDGGFFGWNWLLKNYSSVEIQNRKSIELDYIRDLQNVRSEKTYVPEMVLDSYRYIHPYMYKRRLTDEIIEMFDVGYDRDSDCITFPVRDFTGNTLFVAKRSVRTKFFNYPAGVEKPVYGLYEISEAIRVSKLENNFIYYGLDFTEWDFSSIIICESIIDALTAWVYGKAAVALNGLGTAKQFADLRAFSCRKYILATDMDEAGKSARERIRKALKDKIVTEYVWDLSKAKDLNDMDQEMFDSLEEIF